MNRRVSSSVDIGMVGWKPGTGKIEVAVDQEAYLDEHLNRIGERRFDGISVRLGERDPLKFSRDDANVLAGLLSSAVDYVDRAEYGDFRPDDEEADS